MPTLPLYLLFEFGVLVAAIAERRSPARTGESPG